MMHPAPGVEAQPRAQGRARIGVAAGPGGATRLVDLYQQGSAKCLLPRGPGVEAVFLNTAGGLTGGDHLAYTAAVGPGADLTLTTQTAERVYRAQPGTAARLDVTLTLGPGARAAWLPQETILFDRAALSRRLEVDMAADATLTLLEPLILGRTAMGERVATGHLTDHWRIRRAGRLVHAEALRLGPSPADTAARPFALGGARAMACLVHLAPDAEDLLPRARAALDGAPGVQAAASAWDGRLVLRVAAADGQALRRTLARFLLDLRGALPRVWQA